MGISAPGQPLSRNMALKPRWNKIVFAERVADCSVGRRWLEIGCGKGPRDPALARIRVLCREALYAGIDMDQASLRLNPHPNTLRADAESLPFLSGAFGLITSDMVFEHLEHPERVLREIERVLAPEGTVLIHCACATHFALLAGRLIKHVLPDHAYRRLVSLLRHRAFDDVFATYYRASTRRQFLRLLSRTTLKLNKVYYLETPLARSGGLGFVESTIRKFLPPALKSTIVVEIEGKQEKTPRLSEGGAVCA